MCVPHTGVEWTFSGGSGVFSMAPKVIPGGTCVTPAVLAVLFLLLLWTDAAYWASDQQTAFRESVFLGTTKLSSREVEAIARELRDDFPPDSYNLVSKYVCVGREQPPCWR